MSNIAQNNFRVRKDFGKIKKIIDLPKLIEIQKKSYEDFLQMSKPPDERKNIGLQEVFNSIFPIKDFNETASLEFVSYHLDQPKYDTDECRQRGMSYGAPMKVFIRLVVWDKDEETGALMIRNVKEQEVYFGEIPLMTKNGTFIINGTERVVVTQLHRSPGAFFDHDKGKTHSSGKILYSARVIPYRGSWLDFEFDSKDILHVRIDRRRKLPATVLLRALGYSTEDLLDFFYSIQEIVIESGRAGRKVDMDLLIGLRTNRDIRAKNEVMVRKGKKITRAAVRRMKKAGVKSVPLNFEDIHGMVAARDIVDDKTGEIVVEANEEITEEKLDEIRTRKIKKFKTVFIDNSNIGPYIHKTLLIDKINTPEEAIMEIYRRMRPGDPPTEDSSNRLFKNLFFNPERYDLSRVGRLKLNYKFGMDEPLENSVLTKNDIMQVVKHLISLRDGHGMVDDIDHLGNRRVRPVGELLENQYRIGLVRMERAIKERMTLQEIDTLMPHDLVNSKPVSAVVKEFFGSSQLSQFMDQTNPLSEVTHKRRLSALGPGGLTRERAGFEVRDVHATHYGRICPIETPEGPNIGLIASLSTYARVNDFGFIETPYRTVKDGKALSEVKFYSALEESALSIAQANAPLNKNGEFIDEFVSCRQASEFVLKNRKEVSLMDVSPNQLVSVAASLIPFLENDDANRALMGSNMQRQAVPLLSAKAPLVGTGIEPVVARDSGVTVVAERDGIVDSVDASRIVVRTDPSQDGDEAATSHVDIYNLIKYQRSNQNTCINQITIVKEGDLVKKGDVLADGPSTETGELALGQNVLVAFMPWGGYNFEDSILVSERMLVDDVFTSIHIDEFETVARDTKLGKEEITRDIPNVGDEALKDLDESGIVRIGAEVKPGDILVGKITPKGETQLSPEEKLLRAIFGEKAGDVRDSSLRVPPGVNGIVIDARVFSRKGVEKDSRSIEIEEIETNSLLKDQNDQIKIIQESAHSLVCQLFVGQKPKTNVAADNGKVLLEKGKKITEEAISGVARKYLSQIKLTNQPELEDRIGKILNNAQEEIARIKTYFTEKINRLKKGDELAPGIIKMIKVYIAMKRKLAVGDKMAGRHGNKGVVSRILPIEDMPHLPDGQAVDIVLNPLGVPSRMNVGQILETHLGMAARGLGEQLNRYVEENYSPEKIRLKLKSIFKSAEFNKTIEDADDEAVINFALSLKDGVHMSTPVFDGAPEEEIQNFLEATGYSRSGQTLLYDGRTGEAFFQDVTVGVMYMLKLHHLVDDKIHARSIGPYSLVTQQPLGGKAQFGGQRLGEMEVWAMEAYGAAHALQEFLTVKSDDTIGRTRMYEAVVKGEYEIEPGLPESFNVLIKELQSLGLNIELLDDKPAI